jgi:hypothetical protein
MKIRDIKRRHVTARRAAHAHYLTICYRPSRKERENFLREWRLAEARVQRFSQPTDAERNALYMWAPKWHTYKTITKD